MLLLCNQNTQQAEAHQGQMLFQPLFRTTTVQAPHTHQLTTIMGFEPQQQQWRQHSSYRLKYRVTQSIHAWELGKTQLKNVLKHYLVK